MLQWFVKDSSILDGVLEQTKLLQLGDITDIERVPTKCLDENVTQARIQKYFKADAWKKITSIVESIRDNRKWECSVCSNELDGHSIGCDVCLEWYHLRCAALSTAPKKKNWICRRCYRPNSQN